jgi:hypothetical protein
MEFLILLFLSLRISDEPKADVGLNPVRKPGGDRFPILGIAEATLFVGPVKKAHLRAILCRSEHRVIPALASRSFPSKRTSTGRGLHSPNPRPTRRRSAAAGPPPPDLDSDGDAAMGSATKCSPSKGGKDG